MWGAARIALVVVLALVCRTASADELANARRAVEALDYAGAKTALIAALDSGKNSPDAMVELYRLTGIVAAALGETKEATDAFTKLLALSPKASLPAGTSPKITRPFETAGRYFASHKPLAVEAEKSATEPSVTLVVTSDPLGMIAKAHVVFTVDGGAEQRRDVAGGSDRIAIPLPKGKRIDVRVSALDDKGNRLLELGTKGVPIVIVMDDKKQPDPVVTKQPAKPPKPVVAKSRPLYLKWWLHAGISAAFLGGAVYFGFAARSDADELRAIGADSSRHEFSEALDIQHRAERAALFANIGFGAAGAFALSAGVLYLIRPREPQQETRLTAVPIHGGGALVLGGTF